MRQRRWVVVALLLTIAAGASRAQQAGHVTSPKEEWGHNVGDDYFLADYQQLIANAVATAIAATRDKLGATP